MVEQEDQIARLREFGPPAVGRVAEAAVFGVVLFEQGPSSVAADERFVERHGQRAAAFFHLGLGELDDRLGVVANPLGLLRPDFLHLLSEL